MIFTYKKWDGFCAKLKNAGIQSIPACKVGSADHYLVLKHDVETSVPNAYRMAQIEAKYGHSGSYYVQAYLLEDRENIALLKKMQAMGHEVSYHYDVMDSCKGNLQEAMAEFEKNRKLFAEQGFALKTVCQHGNPVVDRVGYTSNRDFFRSELVQAAYPELADIMVDFPDKYQTRYLYFSDAGRQFKQIYDPINNDITPSDEKNIPYKDLDALFLGLNREKGNIISTHPHRWTASEVKYGVKSAVFKTVKTIAKLLIKIPFMKKLMGRFYYLAKKF